MLFSCVFCGKRTRTHHHIDHIGRLISKIRATWEEPNVCAGGLCVSWKRTEWVLTYKPVLCWSLSPACSTSRYPLPHSELRRDPAQILRLMLYEQVLLFARAATLLAGWAFRIGTSLIGYRHIRYIHRKKRRWSYEARVPSKRDSALRLESEPRRRHRQVAEHCSIPNAVTHFPSPLLDKIENSLTTLTGRTKMHRFVCMPPWGFILERKPSYLYQRCPLHM